MQYRQFGNMDWKVSALGFGLMRLPMLDKETEAINEAEALRMVRHAVDMGVNYLDTAYMYHKGASEPFLGKVLKDGYREKVKIATKMPCWLVKTTADFDTYLTEQLKRLQVEHIDFYLLHALNQSSWDKMHNLGVLEWAEKQIAAGKIGRLGFSFHDSYSAFEKIINDYDKWTFCQIQYNYMDIGNQAGQKGLQMAASKGLGVIVMEPLRGGKLANVPEPVAKVFRESGIERTPVEWALQWVWDQPKVSFLLSGMSAMDQVEQNLVYAGRSGVGSMQESEREVVSKVRTAYEGMVPIPCTQCRYCMPCPNGVDIPENFDVFNKGALFEDWDEARFVYDKHISMEAKASACIDCDECEEKCPQQIMISDWMPYVDAVLTNKEKFDGRTQPIK